MYGISISCALSNIEISVILFLARTISTSLPWVGKKKGQSLKEFTTKPLITIRRCSEEIHLLKSGNRPMKDLARTFSIAQW